MIYRLELFLKENVLREKKCEEGLQKRTLRSAVALKLDSLRCSETILTDLFRARTYRS